MIAELGHYALVLALGLALVQSCVPIVGARKNDPALMAVAGPTAVAQFFGLPLDVRHVTLSTGCLAARKREGLVSITLVHSSCVTSYLPM